jgi:hypothetical protein
MAVGRPACPRFLQSVSDYYANLTLSPEQFPDSGVEVSVLLELFSMQ